jgi:hypothetical protein
LGRQGRSHTRWALILPFSEKGVAGLGRMNRTAGGGVLSMPAYEPHPQPRPRGGGSIIFQPFDRDGAGPGFFCKLVQFSALRCDSIGVAGGLSAVVGGWSPVGRDDIITVHAPTLRPGSDDRAADPRQGTA